MYLNASDVAAAAGLNKFKSPLDIAKKYNGYEEDISEDVKEITCKIGDDNQIDTLNIIQNIEENVDSFTQKRNYENTIEDITNKKIKKIKILEESPGDCSEEIEKVISECKNKIKIVDDIFSGKSTKKEEEKKIHDEVIENSDAVKIDCCFKSLKIRDSCMNGMSKSAKDMLCSSVSKKRGINEESKILDSYEKVSGKKITKRNSSMYYTKIKGITIGGRIDGFDEKDNKLVEVKNRTYKLFNTIPIYEKVQCEIYMKMLNIDSCVHIERFNGMDIKKEYKSNPLIVEKIEKGLEEYIKILKKINFE